MSSYPVLIVVEDDPDDFFLLKRALWQVGATARVWWVKDSDETLALLKELEQTTSGIGLVLDVKLGGLDGFEILERIRARPSPARLKVAFLTGCVDAATKERVHAQGVDALFHKEPHAMQDIARSLQLMAMSALASMDANAT